MNLTLFIPCFVDLISPQAGISIVNILEGLGHQIDYPEELGCCGQPPFNAGYWDEAREAARPDATREVADVCEALAAPDRGRA